MAGMRGTWPGRAGHSRLAATRLALPLGIGRLALAIARNEISPDALSPEATWAAALDGTTIEESFIPTPRDDGLWPIPGLAVRDELDLVLDRHPHRQLVTRLWYLVRRAGQRLRLAAAAVAASRAAGSGCGLPMDGL